MKIEINGISLHYEETGIGDVIIFLHGNSEDLTIFSDAVGHFKDRYRCVAVDSRGHGSSGGGTERLTIPLLAGDIIEFMDAKGFDGVTLVGFSDGGNVALEVAAESERVKNLVVVGANLLFGKMTFPSRLSIRLTEALCLPLSFVPSLKRMRRRFYLMSHQPEITAQKLSRIMARTLVVAGTHDVIKTSHTEEIARGIPSSALRLFEGHGHFLFRECSEELLKTIDEFLSESSEHCRIRP